MTWPRASALAEVAWTNPEHKDFENFKKKLDNEYQRFEADGINYARSAYDPNQQVVFENNIATVSLNNNAYNAKIYYTLDGSEPSAKSILYTGPFKVKGASVIKSAVFVDGKKVGKVLNKPIVFN